MERAIDDGEINRVVTGSQFSFDDDLRNRLQFQSTETGPLGGTVKVTVEQYMPSVGEYLSDTVEFPKANIFFLVCAMAVPVQRFVRTGDSNRFFTLRRDEDGGFSFNLETALFPEGFHIIDQPLFNQ